VRGFSVEQEKGQTLYEAQLTVDGHSKDILIEATGAVVEVEEEVAMDKIRKVEMIKKRDKLVAYEAQVVTNGKKSEIQVGPDGKTLDHEE
jgi:hypothetical protein